VTTSIASYLRIVATILISVATALAPTYGHEWWYAIVVGVGGGLSLAAPSILPTPSVIPKA
jgi:hypothetical protein